MGLVTVMSQINPCLSCGACCASFRVSFYWRETSEAGAGGVPVALTEPLSDFYSCMKGTNQKNPRCTALQGEVGQQVACAIYPQRSTTCRTFNMIEDDGAINQDCNRARARHGLPPLTLFDLTGVYDVALSSARASEESADYA